MAPSAPAVQRRVVDIRTSSRSRSRRGRIDRTFTLDDVPEALAHVGNGHAQGMVVIAVG
jgi:hypothetical protein